MTLSGRLERHFQHIQDASSGLSLMKFREPGIFTNSQIHPPPITSLIRDTERHERILFSIPTNDYITQNTSDPTKKSTLLGSILDGNVLHQMRNVVRNTHTKGEVDVEILLQGAENLSKIYQTPGLHERIEKLRLRFHDLHSSIALHEELIVAQRNQLDLQRGGDYEDDFAETPLEEAPVLSKAAITDADIEAEENLIKELETRKDIMESEIRELDRKIGTIMSTQSR